MDKQNNCISEHRVGRFEVVREMLESLTDQHLAAFFANFVIVRTEVDFVCDSIEFTAYSPLFRVCLPGDVAPRYPISAVVDDDGNLAVGLLE